MSRRKCDNAKVDAGVDSDEKMWRTKVNDDEVYPSDYAIRGKVRGVDIAGEKQLGLEFLLGAPFLSPPRGNSGDSERIMMSRRGDIILSRRSIMFLHNEGEACKYNLPISKKASEPVGNNQRRTSNLERGSKTEQLAGASCTKGRPVNMHGAETPRSE
ncbi:hypothetical protein WN51_09782 [Melipona quadrifasciata]|uniref:Uncharacterized protein n=1 Tax=Melipona quadrifasciata TaxID=166423 RepID=A0A0N0U6B8_9HYME|nr:hypothetical protein WN51_09782 [Melipona quadrifasciata]